MLKDAGNNLFIGCTSECPHRIYFCDTCGITKNTCYRSDKNVFPDFCTLRTAS